MTSGKNGYPNADIIIDDIIPGQALCGLEEGELLAYAAVTKSPEKSYEAIYEGSWQGENQNMPWSFTVMWQMSCVAQTFLEGFLIEGLII